jgi:hypothetical protein
MFASHPYQPALDRRLAISLSADATRTQYAQDTLAELRRAEGRAERGGCRQQMISRRTCPCPVAHICILSMFEAAHNNAYQNL